MTSLDRDLERADTRTLVQLAREALDVQNACNPLGISRSFARAMLRLRDLLEAEGKGGTRALCEHPIAVAWASKISDLHSANFGNTAIEAFGELETMASE
jgi:hypothetical protein